MYRIFLSLICMLVVSSAMAQGKVNAQKTNAQSITTPLSPINYTEIQQQLDRASEDPWALKALRRLRNPLGEDAMLFSKIKLNSALGFGYTRETGFLVNGVIAGEYKTDEQNQQQTPSMLRVSAQVSVKGFFQLKAEGENYLHSDERILSYDISYGVLPIRFWGLGYDAAIKNSRSEYSRRAFAGSVRFLNRIVGDFYGGASLDMRYNKASSTDELARLYISQHGMTQQNAFTTGLGLNLLFDHRDNIYATNSGWFVSLLTEIRPKGLGDCGSTLWHVKAIADYFTPIWQGGVLGVDLYADLWSSATPWFMWPCIGGGSRMRGYYFGRYTDRKIATAQVELRQNIYGPFGCAVWGGVGSVFDSHKNIDFSELLPNYGLGLRINLGKNSRLRIDYGFGHHSNGLVIGMNEAF